MLKTREGLSKEAWETAMLSFRLSHRLLTTAMSTADQAPPIHTLVFEVRDPASASNVCLMTQAVNVT